MNAIGYIRRSKQSDERTVSLDEQTVQIWAYCAKRGWTPEFLVDDGVSGGDRTRFQTITQRIREGNAQAVVVYNLDRFARDVAGLLDTLNAFEERGVELHVVGRGRVETKSSTGFLMTSIEGVLAEHYRKVVSEKTTDALARLKAKHRRYSGEIPYGWSLDGTSLTLNESESRVVQEVKALRQQGQSYREISQSLAQRGIVARSGHPFSTSTLFNLMRR